MRYLRSFSIVLAISFVWAITPLLGEGVEREAGTLGTRVWQFHHLDWSYLESAIRKAADSGMNRIQLSHNIVHDAEQLWEGDQARERLDIVRKCVELAHQLGIKVDIWTHELSSVPPEFIEDGKCRLSPDLWKWVRRKYERVFTLVPGLDGLVLTFAETDYEVYKPEKVITEEQGVSQIIELIRTMAEVCEEQGGKMLYVRTFCHNPEQLAWLAEAVELMQKRLAAFTNIGIMTKCVPMDWTPYFPYNPLLGKTKPFPQLVEIDLGQEFTGKSELLHCEVDYVKRVLDYARSKGVAGAVARIERNHFLALGTPNEVNIHAFSRLCKDRNAGVEELWQEWTTNRYGTEAAPHIARALKRTFDITNAILFPLGEWINNHSRNVGWWNYPYGHITSVAVRNWVESPRYEYVRDVLLLRPVRTTILMLKQQHETNRALIADFNRDIDMARTYLRNMDIHELDRYAGLLMTGNDVFEAQHLAFFSVLRYLYIAESRPWDLAPGEMELAYDEAQSSIEALQQLAFSVEEQYGESLECISPKRMRSFAGEVKKKLDAAKSSW